MVTPTQTPTSIPKPEPAPKSEEKSETIIIEQNKTKQALHLSTVDDNIITFSLDYNSKNYTKTLSMKDIKTIEGRAVYSVFPASYFFIFLKTAVEKGEVRIIKKENIIIINIVRETSEINIELVTKVVDVEMLEKELKELKVNYNKIIIQNRELRKRLEYLKMK